MKTKKYYKGGKSPSGKYGDIAKELRMVADLTGNSDLVASLEHKLPGANQATRPTSNTVTSAPNPVKQKEPALTPYEKNLKEGDGRFYLGYGITRLTSDKLAGSDAQAKRKYVVYREGSNSETLSVDEAKARWPHTDWDKKTYSEGGFAPGIDPRKDKNRTDQMRKDAFGSLTDGLIGGATSGASSGSLQGVVAGVGMGLWGGMYKGIKGLHETRDQIMDDAETWKKNLNTYTMGNYAKKKFKSGGKVKGGIIEGAGTEKSDSIDMRVPPGSFIVPAENKDTAINIGREYLGWDDDTMAKRNYGGENIKVSDNEVYFTKDEANLLSYYNVPYANLAPNADPDKKGFSEGGEPWKKPKTMLDMSYDEPAKDEPLTEDQQNTKKKYDYAMGTLKKPVTHKKEEKEKPERSVFDYIPEMAGTLQALAGASALINAGASPDVSVSNTLKRLSTEVRQMANYGYEPKVLNALNNQIEKSYRNMSNTIVGKGGSPMEVMSKLKESLDTVIDKKAQIAYADAAEKARKYTDVIRVDMAKAGQEFDASKIKLEDYQKKQEAYGSLLSAGISNIVGARKYKATTDAIKRDGNTNIHT